MTGLTEEEREELAALTGLSEAERSNQRVDSNSRRILRHNPRRKFNARLRNVRKQ